MSLDAHAGQMQQFEDFQSCRDQQLEEMETLEAIWDDSNLFADSDTAPPGASGSEPVLASLALVRAVCSRVESLIKSISEHNSLHSRTRD